MPQIEIKWTIVRFDSNRANRSDRTMFLTTAFFLVVVVIGLANHCNQKERITFYSRKIIDWKSKSNCLARIELLQNAKYMANRLRHATKIIQIKIIFHIDCLTHFTRNILQFDLNPGYGRISTAIIREKNTARSKCVHVLIGLNEMLCWATGNGMPVIGFLSSRDECQFKSFAI